jgi:hypothetical protein
MLDNIEGAINNGKSRETSRRRKKTKRKQQQQHTTQYVLDTTIRKQAQIK